ncbi:translocon-associated protein [Musa troglodytarum]|uniref:Translocon-associated protein subunit alpha n=1 Tax=Musa troglodytarum TaxID=320322 RepID=A0A9E7GG02_9LILI|nr:translocon-associated protein [Musa troglodytarum]
MAIRVFSLLIALLLFASPILQDLQDLSQLVGIVVLFEGPVEQVVCYRMAAVLVARCQSDKDVAATEVLEGSNLGIVGDDTQVFGDGTLGPALGIDTICVFPKNAARLVPAGEETELLVGLHNKEVVALRASLHLPFDHRMFVQNLTLQEFYNASVPVSAQATFPYVFAVSKYLQPGSFDLVGTIVYEIDQQPYQSIFYNGTIEVVEAGGFLSIESVFLVTLGVALIGFLGLWAYGQIQQFSKKTKRSPKVEVGTGTTDANMDEWLEGTAYAQSLSSKSKKKK